MNAIKFTIIYMLSVLVPFWFVNKIWFVQFVLFGILLGIGEIASYVMSGKTLSKRFWEESRRNKILGVVSLTVFYVYLFAHLIFKI